MSILTPITLWSRESTKGVFKYNHLADGHCFNDKPTPKVNQDSWARSNWIKEFAWLNDQRKVIHDPTIT